MFPHHSNVSVEHIRILAVQFSGDTSTYLARIDAVGTTVPLLIIHKGKVIRKGLEEGSSLWCCCTSYANRLWHQMQQSYVSVRLQNLTKQVGSYVNDDWTMPVWQCECEYDLQTIIAYNTCTHHSLDYHQHSTCTLSCDVRWNRTSWHRQQHWLLRHSTKWTLWQWSKSEDNGPHSAASPATLNLYTKLWRKVESDIVTSSTALVTTALDEMLWQCYTTTDRILDTGRPIRHIN